jgi:hypothetical protein
MLLAHYAGVHRSPPPEGLVDAANDGIKELAAYIAQHCAKGNGTEGAANDDVGALIRRAYDPAKEFELLNLEERFAKAEQQDFVRLELRKMYKQRHGRQDPPALPSPQLAPEQPKSYQEMHDAIKAELDYRK